MLLLKEKEHLFVDKHYFKIHFIYVSLLLIINPILIYPLYIFACWTSILGGACINTFCHLKGKPDNVWIWTLIFSDGHHKYHHDNPGEYKQPFPIWTNTFIRMIKK